MDMLDSVLLTHLDHDHYHAGWATALPGGATLRMHKRHLAAARRDGGLPESVEPFDSAFDLYPGVRVTSAVASHDDLGVASFRFDFASDGHEASLGFATDLGRVTDHLVEHLSGVDVLAIESNYCPHLQAASDRPWFLKRRIMGGSGHLSNEECLRAIDRIGPRSHVVLLHLSRQCNRPDLVAAMHEGADYAVTIAEQERASRWVHIHGCPGRRRPSPSPVAVQLPLFGLGDAAAAVPAPTPAAAAKAPTM
jgi:phosphoribosyl 1,2-cyclic phosphodiesterase